ncbi:MAG: MarR family winged helix-turn-helix transcriptional regulator [Treponema sp.]|jgi:hypothetical protein|nr:MarR family winged helix-turn-helix transcriptional regulator [Treponema sp.]
MKNENYITLQGWMINELQLAGGELIIYAIIYGFSQDGKTKYKGSMQYLADSAGISRRATLPILKKLVDKGYIIKETDKSGKKCDYYTNLDILKNAPCEETSHQTYEETSHSVSQHENKLPIISEETSHQTYEETSHHIDLNKDILINNNIPPESAENKIAPSVQKSVSSKKLELNEYQLKLFNAAKSCFDLYGNSKAMIYKNSQTAAMQMRILKEIVISCTNIEPDLAKDFLKTVLDHFKVLCSGKLKGRAEFTPRSLATPWIWETVIGSLPKPENELDEKIRQSIKGMFK